MKFPYLLLATVLLCSAALMVMTGVGVSRAEQQHDPIGQFITVKSVKLHYVIAGEGPAIVLVHGASSNLREFSSSLLPELAKTHRVIAFDRPGYGFSERPSEAAGWLNPVQVASLLLDASEALGVHKPLILGHSWAGSVVMSALVHLPERVSGGVLLSGVAGHWTGPLDWKYTLAEQRPWLNKLFAHTLVQPIGKHFVQEGLAEVFAPDPVPEGQVERSGIELALRPKTYLYNVRDMNELSVFMQTLSPHYQHIKSPLLIIHGEADTLVPFWNHGRRLLPVIPQAQVLLLPKTGHAPHHTKTAEVTVAVLAFSRGEVRPPLAQPWPIWPELPAVDLGQP
jgi:pimeloyl-ACP methyl ester carboxylesterase